MVCMMNVLLSFTDFIQYLIETKKNLFRSRYDIYLYVAPLKIIAFIIMAVLLANVNIIKFFGDGLNGWKEHVIEIQEVNSTFF